MKERKNDIDYAKEAGKKLSEARKKLGMTQVEVANKLGVSISYYCHLEQGRSNPRHMGGAIRLNIKKVLKVSI